MKIVNISIVSTSDSSADVTNVVIGHVLRENETFRYIFCPTMVKNKETPDACIRGSIIVQRKSKKEKWEDCNTLKVTNLKVSEWGKLELNCESIMALITYADALRDIYIKDGGIPAFYKNKAIILDGKITDEDKEAFSIIKKTRPDLFKEMKSLLQLNVDLKSVIEFIESNGVDIEGVANEISLKKAVELYDNLKLRFISIDLMKSQLESGDEKYWQDYFENNPHLLSMVIPNVLYIIESKAYVGGKGINNKGGSVIDFIYNSGINNVALIEIKTPKTQLLSKNEYRDNVYAMSSELAGAISQVKDQKEKLTKEYNTLVKNSSNVFNVYDPHCYIIIGNSDELNSEEKVCSFELIRSSLKDITIITYDELITKVSSILSVLKNK